MLLETAKVYAVINLQLYRVLEFNIYIVQYIDTGCAVIGISTCDGVVATFLLLSLFPS